MRTLRAPALFSALACLALGGCPSDDKKGDEKAEKKDEKKEEKKEDGKLEPMEAADDGDAKLPELDLSGPVPPETNAVFFAVDGAMIPLACFDQKSGKLDAGKACLKMVEKDQEVLLSSEYGRALDKVGDPKNALCEVGDTPTSLGTPALDSGQTYEWATWPKSLGTKAEQTKSDTKSDTATALSDDEKAKLTEAVLAKKPGAEKGELRCNQKASLDIDGDGVPETFFSVLVAHPTSPDRSLFSGLYMAPGGDLGQLKLIEFSKRDLDVLTIRGAVDLQGDGNRELWVGLTFDGGSGDRIVVLDGDKATPLGKWTCGA
jgi:hypothetical protein